MMALLSMSVNGYAVDMTTNQNQESSNVINVTANRTALLDLDTPVAMNVITPEELKNTGATTAFDAVATVPGVTINSYGAGGADFGGMDSRTNIRGLDRGALVLVNGVPMNLNGKGGLGSIPTSAIKRIEVVKGAASTLYGAEARHLQEQGHHGQGLEYSYGYPCHQNQHRQHHKNLLLPLVRSHRIKSSR